MKPLHDTDFITIDCSTGIDWEVLTKLAKTCLKTDKTLRDGITFSWIGGSGKLEVDQNCIDVEAFKTAIAALDVVQETKNSLLKNIREDRTKLLEETDWMANSDVTMSDEWKTYRQALRDLPANTSDPANPTWPTKPS